MCSFLKNISKLILISLTFSIVFRIIFTYPLSNDYIPGGTDTHSHLFRTWYIAKYDLLKWNYYWAGGHPFLRYYPPLQYWISGYLGKFIGWLLSYKLIVNSFFVLIPLAFYLFLIEFKLSKESIALSVIIFSLFPVFYYFFFDGRHPTLISFFFTILYWKFLKKSIDTNKPTFLFLSSIFLLLSLLVHYLTAGFIIGISFIWLLFHYKNATSFFKILKIITLTFLLSIWFWAPLLIETLISQQTMEAKYVIGDTTPIETGRKLLLAPFIYLKSILKSDESAYVLYVLIFSLGIFSFISLLKLDRSIKDFLIVLILILLLLLILSYKRLFIFISIPLSILASKGIILFKKTRYIFIFIVIMLSILSCFALKQHIYHIPFDIPKLPNDGRVIYFPVFDAFKQSETELKSGYDLLLPSIQGNENILGWMLNFEADPQRVRYLQKLKVPLEINQSSEYHHLLKEGWVNYVVVNKNSTEIIEYFNRSNNFRLYNKTELFFVFEVYPKSSYIEINDEPIRNIQFKKENDNIFINFTCFVGTLKIKEGYHQNWNVLLNNKKIELYSNEYGFIKTKINDNGLCTIKLSFSDPDYYIIFKIIPLITLCFSIFLFFRKN